MRPAHYTSLLPDLFQHKSSRVRLFQPQVILIDFHGTISERRWEDRVIYPYVRRALPAYLRDNWHLEPVQRCLPGLRHESFEQHFRHKNEDAPVIEEQLQEGEELEPQRLAQQMGEFVLWQMGARKETRESQQLERLVWLDGFRRRQIQTPIYEDVMPQVRQWRERYNCPIYVISSIDADTLRLLLENTDRGNLSQLLAGYVSARRTGDKLIGETYKRFFERLQAAAQVGPASSKAPRSPPPPPSSPSQSAQSAKEAQQASSNSQALKRSTISSTGSNSGEGPRPVLFLTDSGQEAKAASQAAPEAFECLLVNRPGNKRIRTYYLSQFQYVDRFDDIEFV